MTTLFSDKPDDLRGHTVSAGYTASVSTFIARSHEATWRERCQRWIEAEHRDSAS